MQNGDKYAEMMEIVDFSISRENEKLMSNFSKMISKNEQIWMDLCDFSCVVNSSFLSESSWRQDGIGPDGLRAAVDEMIARN